MLDTRKIHLEISSKCVIKCPRCPRTELHPDTLNKEFSLQDFKAAFDTDILREVEEFLFCGDIGDPIYARDFLPIVEYIKDNSDIRLKITTNGSYKKEDWWTKLGELLDADDIITFSVDGWSQESNERYRVNTDFDSILLGIRTLKKLSAVHVRWKAIYFSYNEYDMFRIRELAESVGCDDFKTVKSTKFDNQYLVDGHDPLKPETHYAKEGQYIEETHTFKKSPAAELDHRTNRHPWAKCINNEKELFVNVEGLILPCPWFNSGYVNNAFVAKYREQLNIKTRGLKAVVADGLWQEFVKSFDTNPLKICQIKCKNTQ